MSTLKIPDPSFTYQSLNNGKYVDSSRKKVFNRSEYSGSAASDHERTMLLPVIGWTKLKSKHYT